MHASPCCKFSKEIRRKGVYRQFMANIFDLQCEEAQLPLEAVIHESQSEGYLETHHSKLWARSQFSELSKVDYVHNNLAESFNSTIRKLKGHYVVDLLDRIRIEYMQKFHYHAGIAEAKFMGHIIISAVMNELKQKTTGLEMNMTLCSGTTAEISYLDKEKREWRYPVDLEARTCSCRQWQITGLSCIHALFFITSLPGPAGNI